MPSCPEFIQFVNLKLFLPYFSSSLFCLSLVYFCMQSCTEVLVHLEPTAISISSTSCLVSIFLGFIALLPRRLCAIFSSNSGRPLISAELSLPVSSPPFSKFSVYSVSFQVCTLSTGPGIPQYKLFSLFWDTLFVTLTLKKCQATALFMRAVTNCACIYALH